MMTLVLSPTFTLGPNPHRPVSLGPTLTALSLGPALTALSLGPALTALSPQPLTLSPQPLTLSPQPLTLSPQPITLQTLFDRGAVDGTPHRKRYEGVIILEEDIEASLTLIRTINPHWAAPHPPWIRLVPHPR